MIGDTRVSHQAVVSTEASNEPDPPWTVSIPFFAGGVLFSIWYLNAYYSGDALSYINFYNSLYGMPSQHWPHLQRMHLNSSEPLYVLLLAIGAFFGADRVLYIAMWNGILIGAIGYVLQKYRSLIIFNLFVFTNFYIFVLLASAERLKFSYVFLILSFAVSNRSLKFALAAASPFIHTQAIVQFASGFGYFVVANIGRFSKTPLRSMLLLVILIATIAGIAYGFYASVGQSIEDKSAYYSSVSSGFLEAVQWGMLLVAGALVFRERLAYLVAMLPMGILTIMFGNRVNVATLALFAGLAIVQRKTGHPVVLIVMAYMSVKSIPFMLDVIKYGTGFL